MRSLALATGLVLAAAGAQPPPGAATVAVVIDSAAEAADAVSSARLRQLGLDGLERPPAAPYFDLSPDGVRPVSEANRDAFRRTTFANQPSRYNGVALSVDDAAEILRGNEAVRDAIVQRECAASPVLECGGSVPAAATARAADAEEATRRKLLHLVEAARVSGAATLVVVTAGWPYRDEGRIGLARAAEALRALGTHLVVMRVPSRAGYRGLVRDAGETLAGRLQATFLPVTTEAEAARANAVISARRGEATAAQTMPGPEAAAGAIPPFESLEPATGAPAPELPAGLQAAAAYVDRFEREFSSIVWRERYQQELRVERQFATSGARSTVLAGRRTIDSEMFFLWLPEDASWIAVRDVVAIDGTARAAADRRLQALLTSGAVSAGGLRVLAAGNGQFDIGHIQRTFTEPTLVLLFLDSHYRHRFAFVKAASQPANGRAAVRWDFEERSRPTVIRNRDQDMPARGSFSVDAATGRIVETALELRAPAAALVGRIGVRYGPHPRFDVLVPVEMRESFANATERITTLAAYSDFRRFETAGRLVPD